MVLFRIGRQGIWRKILRREHSSDDEIERPTFRNGVDAGPAISELVSSVFKEMRRHFRFWKFGVTTSASDLRPAPTVDRRQTRRRLKKGGPHRKLGPSTSRGPIGRWDQTNAAFAFLQGIIDLSRTNGQGRLNWGVRLLASLPQLLGVVLDRVTELSVPRSRFGDRLCALALRPSAGQRGARWALTLGKNSRGKLQ